MRLRRNNRFVPRLPDLEMGPLPNSPLLVMVRRETILVPSEAATYWVCTLVSLLGLSCSASAPIVSDGLMPTCHSEFVDAGVIPVGSTVRIPFEAALTPDEVALGVLRRAPTGDYIGQGAGTYTFCELDALCPRCARGAVTARPVQVEPSLVEFPATLPPSIHTVDLRVQNLTDASLTLRGRSLSSFFDTSTPTLQLASRQQGLVRLVFNPSLPLGSRDGAFQISVDGTGFEQFIAVQGFVGGPDPQLEFPSLDLGVMPAHPSVPSYRRRVRLVNSAPTGQGMRGDVVPGVVTVKEASCLAGSGAVANVSITFEPHPRLAPGDVVDVPVWITPMTHGLIACRLSLGFSGRSFFTTVRFEYGNFVPCVLRTSAIPLVVTDSKQRFTLENEPLGDRCYLNSPRVLPVGSAILDAPDFMSLQPGEVIELGLAVRDLSALPQALVVDTNTGSLSIPTNF
jgi:hypothetical protein